MAHPIFTEEHDLIRAQLRRFVDERVKPHGPKWEEAGFVPRKGSTAEGDGYVVGIASNYAEMASELHIVDAQRMEEGAVAVVKLPFRLRGGTHVNWFSADELAAQKADAV